MGNMPQRYELAVRKASQRIVHSIQTFKVVQCYNRGFDGRDVQWECKAEMTSDYQFGKVVTECALC